MGKMLIAGSRNVSRSESRVAAADMLLDGRINVGPLITHRLPWTETAEAYHMLYNNPEEALAVILEWDE